RYARASRAAAPGRRRAASPGTHRHGGGGEGVALGRRGGSRSLSGDSVRRGRSRPVREPAGRYRRHSARLGHIGGRTSLSVESRGSDRVGPVVCLRARPVFDRGEGRAVTALGLWLALALLTAQSPAADSLRLLALRIPESALVLETRAHPLAVRDAVTDEIGRASCRERVESEGGAGD